MARLLRLLQRILGLGVTKEEDLKRVQQQLLDEAETDFYRIGARGERALLDEFLAAVQHRELSFAEFRQEVSRWVINLPEPRCSTT